MTLITTSQVALGLDATDRTAATEALASRLVSDGRCTDLDQLLTDLAAREAQMPTGLPGGIAIPHARSEAITEASVVFGRSDEGIDWGAPDGPAHLIFMIAAPAGGGDEHLTVLAALSRSLAKKEFTQALRDAQTDAEVVSLIRGAVGEDEPAAQAAAATAGTPADAPADEGATYTFVAVTSCPTGIAHTFMAAESLERAAAEAGHAITVETQGATGAAPLDAATIAAADAVIFAHDVEVRDRERFAGKPLVDVGVKKAISEGPALIDQAIDKIKAGDTGIAAGGAAASGGLATKVDKNASIGTRIRQWLMTGVSYMIPFVAAGGILIAISFMLAQLALGETGVVEITNYSLTAEGDYNIATHFDITSLTSWAALLFVIGAASFGFLVPILSAFIAFAIADRPGLVPGLVGGSIAVTMGAGFLGGIVTGFLGGLLALWVTRWKVAKGVRGVMPVVVIPLVSTLLTAGLFITVLGRPIVELTNALNGWLDGMSGASAILLGAILGAMMGFDLGGPVNKVAYTFATTGLAAAAAVTDAPQLTIMAAVMAAGMVAPLAMALATAIRPKLFSEPERENGKAAWLLGASFISEGAIPFAAADPIRVIAASLVGSSVTGALAVAFDTTLRAPHGGIWVLPLIGNFALFVLALVIGVAISAAIVIVLKEHAARRAVAHAAAEAAAPAAPAQA